MTVVELARKFSYVREADSNAGLRVEAIQKWGGGDKGDSWCAYFATMILDIYYEGNSPIPRLGSCDEILALAQTKGWVSTTPQVDDLFLFVKNGNDAHHVGIVAVVTPTGFVGLSGNTSEDGLSSNGDRVAEHSLTIRPNGATVFVRYPR